jgi:hypothetical protein
MLPPIVIEPPTAIMPYGLSILKSPPVSLKMLFVLTVVNLGLDP